MTVRLATVEGRRVTPRHNCRLVHLTEDLFDLAIDMQPDRSFLQNMPIAQVKRMALQPNLAFATVEEGYLIAALGIIPIAWGRAMGWMIPTITATKRQMVFTTRLTREYFDYWQQDERFRRIEIYIRDGQPWRESFAKALGMTEGFGPLRSFDMQGNDYWIYARVA